MERAVSGAGSHFNLAFRRAPYQTVSHNRCHARFVDCAPGAPAARSRLLPHMNAFAGRDCRWSCHGGKIVSVKER